MASSDIPKGTYLIENIGFSETRAKRVLDLQGAGQAPGTPIVCYPNHDGDNQKWLVTKLGAGFNIQSVENGSNIFISHIGPGEKVSGTPLQKTAFKLREAGGNNKYQITATWNKMTYAFQAPESSSEPITLKALVASNPRQIWKFYGLDQELEGGEEENAAQEGGGVPHNRSPEYCCLSVPCSIVLYVRRG